MFHSRIEMLGKVGNRLQDIIFIAKRTQSLQADQLGRRFYILSASCVSAEITLISINPKLRLVSSEPKPSTNLKLRRRCRLSF
jgi:hypothetical protein